MTTARTSTCALLRGRWLVAGLHWHHNLRHEPPTGLPRSNADRDVFIDVWGPWIFRSALLTLTAASVLERPVPRYHRHEPAPVGGRRALSTAQDLGDALETLGWSAWRVPTRVGLRRSLVESSSTTLCIRRLPAPGDDVVDRTRPNRGSNTHGSTTSSWLRHRTRSIWSAHEAPMSRGPCR
jgi:hypothetical protein